MALISCNECGAEVSGTAKACPQCGAPKKKMLPPRPGRFRRIGKVLGVIAIGYIGLMIVVVAVINPKGPAPPTPAEKRAQQLGWAERQNAIAAAKAVKHAARNPESVVFDQILANDDGTVICFTYRGQNGFGGMSREQVAFVDGKPRSNAAAWNKHCRRTLHDETAIGGCAVDRTGTLDVMSTVLAPLLLQLERGDGAFAVDRLSVGDCLERMARNFSAPFPDPASRPLGRTLDSFIEVQVHGELRLRNDVERLVVDPAFRDHPVEKILAEVSRSYGVPMSWHPGYRMSTSAVPDIFRDYPVRPLAERVASDGILDAAIIGAAANSVKLDPAAWEGWATEDDIATQFRRLWHVLVLNGTPKKGA